MRKLILGAAVAALLSPLAVTGASAQAYRHHGGYDRDVQREIRECRRELRRADSRREYRREIRECRREIARAQRHDRYDRRDWRRDRYGRYYADRYDRYDRHHPRYGYRGW